MKDNNKKSNKGLIIGLSVGIPAFFLIIGIMGYIFFVDLFSSCVAGGNSEDRSKVLKYFTEKYDIKDTSKIKVLNEKYFAFTGNPGYVNIKYNNKKVHIGIIGISGNSYCDDYQNDELHNYLKQKTDSNLKFEVDGCFKKRLDSKNMEEFLKSSDDDDITIRVQADSAENARKLYEKSVYKIVDYIETFNKKVNDDDDDINYEIRFQKELGFNNNDYFLLIWFGSYVDAYFNNDVEEVNETGNKTVAKNSKEYFKCEREELVHGMCVNNDNKKEEN